MMRIAFLHRDLLPYAWGGVCFQVHGLANALVKRGHKVTCFTLSPKPPGALYEIQQLHLPGPIHRNRLLQWLAFGLIAAVQSYRDYEIVHAHGDDHFLRCSVPHVRTFYGTAKDEMFTATRLRRKVRMLLALAFEHLGGRNSDFCVGISEATRWRYPFIQAIIPCGVDLECFRPGREKSPYPSILFVGTLYGRKRGAWLAEVFREQVKPVVPEAELWMVCAEPIGGADIKWFGKVPTAKLVALYQRAWVFCLPSSYEGFGVPYIEAMACGTPVVASPNVGAKEVLAHGRFGLISEDVDLGTNLVNLLSDSRLRQEYAIRGLERAQDYGWQRIAERYEEVYASQLWGDMK